LRTLFACTKGITKTAKHGTNFVIMLPDHLKRMAFM
jgi:hypothetical protein